MKNILVVEDDRMLSDVLKHALTHNGFKVVTARDGIEGLDRIRDKIPDLIILDIMMPKLDGIEMLKQLRQMEEPGKRIHVIMLSSVDQPEQKIQAFAQQVDDYLVKGSVEPKQIIEKVQKILA